MIVSLQEIFRDRPIQENTAAPDKQLEANALEQLHLNPRGNSSKRIKGTLPEGDEADLRRTEFVIGSCREMR